MKRTLLLICTLLCANMLFAQTFTIGNVKYDVKYNTTDEVNVVDCDDVSLIIIPETVTYNGITYNVTGITGSLGIRNGQWSMYGAFEGCVSMTSISLPNSITSIGERAFYGCSSLTSINIPDNVSSIKKRTFQNCSNLVSVIVGDSVISIEDSAFYACEKLTSLQLGVSLERIENHAFHNCDSLILVNIPNAVTYIGDYAFYDCEALATISIGNNVTSIGNYAFAYSDALTSIIIGESVNSIGYSAFNNNMFSLQNVTCLATIPPILANNTVFPYPNIATVTVPCGSLEAYSAPTSYWNVLFNGRISEDGYDIMTSTNNDAWGSVEIENNCSTATLTATANEGYVFLSWNDGNTENPRVVSLTSDTSFVANFALIDNSSLLEAEAESISFFPNPTKSEITFSQAIEKVEVIDLTGKTIFTFTNAKTINIESLPAGAYYLRLTNNDKTIIRKAIKE